MVNTNANRKAGAVHVQVESSNKDERVAVGFGKYGTSIVKSRFTYITCGTFTYISDKMSCQMADSALPDQSVTPTPGSY